MLSRLSPVSVVLLVLLVVLVAAPLALRPATPASDEDALRLIVITPHNQQIRQEFAIGFSAWHDELHGRPVDVDFRRPGGTSEIRKQLLALYEAAIRRGEIAPDGSCAPGTMPYDLMFGGGTYEHEQLKRGVVATIPGGETVRIPISTPVDFATGRLDDWYGPNEVGISHLYDPDRLWFGVALSSFGILCNKDSLAELGLPVPQSWDDLTDPAYAGWLAMGDPRQSGSVATTYESILNAHGWDEGWRILRSMCANTRYFANDSKKIVLDVSRGEAASGVAIDFYGRFQAQAVIPPGGTPDDSRLEYVEPAGSVYIDPDPVSMLRGGPNPELAMRFIEFLLTDRGQVLWQLPKVAPDAPPDALGPRKFELRRMPALRRVYARHAGAFIDDIDPFAKASTAPSRGWRGMLGPLFETFAINVHEEMRDALKALAEAERRGAPPELLEQMREAFFAMPMHETTGGERLRLSPEHYDTIYAEWKVRDLAPEHRIAYTRFFRERYEHVVGLARDAGYLD